MRTTTCPRDRLPPTPPRIPHREFPPLLAHGTPALDLMRRQTPLVSKEMRRVLLDVINFAKGVSGSLVREMVKIGDYKTTATAIAYHTMSDIT